MSHWQSKREGRGLKVEELQLEALTADTAFMGRVHTSRVNWCNEIEVGQQHPFSRRLRATLAAALVLFAHFFVVGPHYGGICGSIVMCCPNSLLFVVCYVMTCRKWPAQA